MENNVEVNQQHHSVIQNKSLYVSNFIFKRSPNISDNDLSFKLGTKKKYLGNSEAEISLNCTLSNENKDFELFVEITGVFSVVGDTNVNDNIINYEKNILAIIFPFLRSQIAVLTSQPDFTPIVLPVININALEFDE
jgi:preprotein translocase subunit SecB